MTYFTTPPPSPSRTEPDEFAAKADALLDHLETFATEGNAFATDMNSINDSADASKVAAVAAANFKGSWGDLTGALNIPASVLHDDTVWLLKTNLADVTASEPGVAGDWFAVGGITFDTYDLKFVSTTASLDFSAAQVFTVDATSPRTLAFVNAPGATRALTAVIIFSGDEIITWPGGIVWVPGEAPPLLSTYTIVVLFWDGTDWYGNVWGSA